MSDSNMTFGITSIAASALEAQQSRMRIIAENLANADSTGRTSGADPYRRQAPVFEPATVDGGGQGVKFVGAVPDHTAFKLDYQPGNPAADKNGYVKMPNVEPLVEALDMREAQRAYDANLNMIDAARAMEMNLLDLLKQP